MLWITHPWVTIAVFRILIKISFPIHRANAHYSAACHRFPTGRRFDMSPHWSALKGLHKAPGQLGTGCSQLLTPSQPFPALGLARVATHCNKLVPSWPWELWTQGVKSEVPFRLSCLLSSWSRVYFCSRSWAPVSSASMHSQGWQGELHAWNGKFVRKKTGATLSCFSYKKCEFCSRYFEVMTI